MIAARWVLIGATLAGCIFTPRPMIPVGEGDTDVANRGPDAAASVDVGASVDRGVSDTGPRPDDVTPPSFDSSAPADVPGVTTPDAGAGVDTGSSFQDVAVAFDAPATDAGSESPTDCGAADGGDGGCTMDATVTDATVTDATVTDATVTDATVTDAEAGAAGP
jgi:hypothetical protein